MRPVLIASISGILYALIAELPLLPLSPPAPPSRMQDIVGYYIQYGDVLRTMQLIGGFGSMLLLVFLLGLATYLRRLQDRPSSLSAGVVTAGVAVVTMNLIANAASLSIVLNAGRVENTAQIQLLHDFANATDILMSLPIAVVVAFASWILVRGQHADRWIGLAGSLLRPSSRSVPWRLAVGLRYPSHLFIPSGSRRSRLAWRCASCGAATHVSICRLHSLRILSRALESGQKDPDGVINEARIGVGSCCLRRVAPQG